MTTRQPVHDVPGQPLGDDFTQIRGIGPGIANRLHNAGILRFTQLASLSPEEIVAATGDLIGLTVERVEQQDWAGQARELSEIRYEPITDENGGHLHYATFTAELLLDANNRVRRTRLVDVRAGVEDAWAGWDADRVVRFLVGQSGLNAKAETESEPLEIETAESTSVDIEMPAAGQSVPPPNKGDMTAVVYEGPSFVTESPNKIISVEQPWGVHVEWTMALSEWELIADLIPDGQFRLFVFLERIGPGAGDPLPGPDTEPITGGVTVGEDRKFTHDLQFPVGSVSEGTYHLTSVMQLYSDVLPGGLPQPVAGFVELPMILFYNQQ